MISKNKISANQLWTQFNNSKECEHFIYLKQRYMDEYEHEDINEYLENMRQTIYPYILKVVKRPFSFIAECLDGTYQIGIKVTGRKYQLFIKAYHK